MLKVLSALQEALFTNRGSIVEEFGDLIVWGGIQNAIESINADAAE